MNFSLVIKVCLIWQMLLIGLPLTSQAMPTSVHGHNPVCSCCNEGAQESSPEIATKQEHALNAPVSCCSIEPAPADVALSNATSSPVEAPADCTSESCGKRCVCIPVITVLLASSQSLVLEFPVVPARSLESDDTLIRSLEPVSPPPRLI